jgi:acetylornithine deacetylase/succinyl-diaminopimelate desuccinylase-like protein
LLETVNLDEVKRKAGITQVVEDDYTKAFLNYLFNPTFNISTFISGYSGEGTKNMVPNQAICNIDIRFAHNISIDEIYMEINKIVNNFMKNSTTQIELIRNVSYEGSRVNLNSILVKSLIKSFEVLEITTEIWPLSAAAAPLSKIQQELGINYIVGGLGIGGFAHGPNEFIQIQSILNTRLSNYYFLCLYANSMRISGS